MSRRSSDRLRDVLAACDAIEQYVRRGPAEDPLSDGMVFDAVRARLMEIGEAVKDLDHAVREAEPGIPWRQIAGMRDRLAHRYFDTAHGIIAGTVAGDVPELRGAVERLLARLDTPGEGRSVEEGDEG